MILFKNLLENVLIIVLCRTFLFREVFKRNSSFAFLKQLIHLSLLHAIQDEEELDDDDDKAIGKITTMQ